MNTYHIDNVSHHEILLHYLRRTDPNIGGIYIEGDQVHVENNTIDLSVAISNWQKLELSQLSFEATGDVDLVLNFLFSDFIAYIYENSIPSQPYAIVGNQLTLNFDNAGVYQVEIVKGVEQNIIEVTVNAN